MRITAILPVPIGLAQRREAVLAPVAGQPSLVRIVQTLAAVGDVVVAVAEPFVDAVGEALTQHGFSAVRLVAAEAPGQRRHCIAAALHVHGGGPVLLHDIAWPLIAPAMLDRVVSAVCAGADVVMPACAVTDSIKAVDAGGVVTATLDRSPLRTVQYPRGFGATALAQLMNGGGTEEFDELGAVLSAGVPVTIVDGDTATTSIELPRDAAYLAAVINGRADRLDR